MEQALKIKSDVQKNQNAVFKGAILRDFNPNRSLLKEHEQGINPQIMKTS